MCGHMDRKPSLIPNQNIIYYEHSIVCILISLKLELIIIVWFNIRGVSEMNVI